MPGLLSGRFRSVLGTILLASATPLAGGCGAKTEVKGKVTYKGAPVTAGSVTLVAADGTTYSGRISPDGTYSIADVPPGKVAIGVVGPAGVTGLRPEAAGRGTPGPGAGGREAAAIPTAPPPPPPPAGTPIPEGYRNPQTSGLTGTVKPGEPLNIDLQ